MKMKHLKFLSIALILTLLWMLGSNRLSAQSFPIRYATLELFTNTPCPICGSQNPGLFSRLTNYEGEYHLISFYPGKPYSNCVFYQDNIPENTTRFQHYQGEIFGSPTVALNGIDFKSSNGVTNMVMDNLTGGTSWLYVDVEETSGTSRTVNIRLEDVVGGSLTTGKLFAAIVEKEIIYNAPNGETVHHNVFRQFLTNAAGDDVNLASGSALLTYDYEVDGEWNADQTYVIAWVSDPSTKEIYNSGTRFDPDFTSSVRPAAPDHSLSLYPNPASTEVFLTLPESVQTAMMSIYDQQGRLIQPETEVNGPIVSINIVDWSAGRFVVRLTTKDQAFTGTFEVIR